MTFAIVLRREREKKGLTQSDLASKLGFSKSRISMYENGNREPNLEDLEAICDFFNVDMDYMIGKSEVRRSVWYDEFGNEYRPSEYYLNNELVAEMQKDYEDPETRFLMDASRKLSKKGYDAVKDFIRYQLEKEGQLDD